VQTISSMFRLGGEALGWAVLEKIPCVCRANPDVKRGFMLAAKIACKQFPELIRRFTNLIVQERLTSRPRNIADQHRKFLTCVVGSARSLGARCHRHSQSFWRRLAATLGISPGPGRTPPPPNPVGQIVAPENYCASSPSAWRDDRQGTLEGNPMNLRRNGGVIARTRIGSPQLPNQVGDQDGHRFEMAAARPFCRIAHRP